MTIHIGAKKSDIAGTVLMPGDPLRAKWAANKFLSNVTEVNTCLLYTSDAADD